jgi:Trypsin-like peptidase domain
MKIDIGSLVTTPIIALYHSQELGSATGFFYRHDNHLFLITNWHVATGRHFETFECLNKQGGLPDRLRIMLFGGGHLLGGSGQLGEAMDFELTLYRDSDSNQHPEQPLWWEHAAWRRRVDIVAIPLDIPPEVKVNTIDAVNTVPSMLLTVSRDVFVLGYPKGISGGRGLPIWKRASIATEPAIDLDGLPKMLIDTATREGMSGAPVIALADGDFEVEGMPPAYRKPGRVYRFVGVYSGRLGRDEMQAQLGIVWKAPAIQELLQAPSLGQSSFIAER